MYWVYLWMKAFSEPAPSQILEEDVMLEQSYQGGWWKWRFHRHLAGLPTFLCGHLVNCPHMRTSAWEHRGIQCLCERMETIVEHRQYRVSCIYRYCSFITTKNNWAKNGAMGFRILSNNILLQQMINIRSKKPSWRLTACFQAQFPDMKSWKWWTPSVVCTWNGT